MKSKLKISAVIAVLLATSIASSLAQYPGAPAAATINPATGLPIPQIAAVPGVPVAFDPTTGAPIPQPQPGSDWKDPNWKDPDITLTNVSYDNIPLSEVVRSLREQFKEQFDILLPTGSGAIAYANGQSVPVSWPHDWQSDEIVSLRLKNVTASEIFSAMNLLFENNRTPLRWELKMNGNRQIALLRVLIDPVPVTTGLVVPESPEIKRRVYFVGNLIGDAKNGGMTMEQIIKTITDVWQMADATGGNIQFHKDAQLLVVRGTQSQIDFMEQTLKALEQKVDLKKTESAH